MSEDSFDQELIRATKRGCPSCGSHNLTLWCVEERAYLVGTDIAGTTLEYEPRDVFGSSENNDVVCSDCVFVLWNTNDGWAEGVDIGDEILDP